MKWLWKILKFGLIVGLVGTFAAAIAVGAAYYYIEPDLPDINNLRDVRLQVPLKVFTHDNKLIAEFGEQRRTPLNYDQIPDRMIKAFMSAEDANFFEHPGVDYRGLLRAGVQLALTGKKKQGGSTITMQVARNFYLSNQKTYTRKLSEIFLALRIERELSKSEILELYLNKIYLGHRAYGVGAAALVYYGKSVDELDLAQTAMIAGLPKAPSDLNPVTNPTRAIERRNYVLDRMLELGYINKAEHDQAAAQPTTASRYSPRIEADAPYVAEMVRAEVIERFGEDAYTGGYSVYTTVTAADQSAANKGVRDALDAYSERHGYFGPEARLDPLPAEPAALDAALADRPVVGELKAAIVTAVEEKTASIYLGDGQQATLEWEQMKWAQPYMDTDRRGAAPKKAADVVKPGDVIRVKAVQVKEQQQWRLAEIPRVAGALVALDPNSGAIRALVGGYDFYYSKFNRVTQARRQPGSGFKAFIYSAALENGFTPASLINDAPVVFEDPSLEGDWRPENYSGKFFGPTRLREALTKSRNLVSIRLLRSMGIEAALQHISKFGFDPTELPHNLSLALGSADVTPLQMARGYAILANGGYRVEPYFIERIEQDGAGVVFEAQPKVVCKNCLAATAAETDPNQQHAPRVLDERNRYLMYSMMQDVIRRGTATKALELGRKDLAGKTGTTNDQRDAWFNGYNQSLVANAWVGFDDNSKLGRGEVGGKAALPAWMAYMREALKGVPDVEPEMPEGIVTVRIDPRTGTLATASTQGAIFEVFRAESAPGETGDAIGGNGSGVIAPVITPAPTQDLF
ncbi:MAG: penicillin-binding protein 1A [Chromatiaceae bacterium]|nr:penicillin-binding protein 1A [Chromatiaceae bacterium]